MLTHKATYNLTKVSRCYMVKCDENTPAYTPAEVAALARGNATYAIQRRPAEDSMGCGIDEADVRDFFKNFEMHTANKDCGFIRSRPTMKPPGSCSDSYQARVPGCPDAVYIKFFVHGGVLIVSSFKDFDDGQ